MAILGGKKKQKGRQRAEPRLFDGPPPPPQRGRGSKAKPAKKRGFFRWLFKMIFAVGFWGTVAAAGLFAITWFSLDQKGLFQVPEREPGIMILASDGSEIAEQGTFFGDAVAMAELPAYVPNAIISIEGPALLQSFWRRPHRHQPCHGQQYHARTDA